VIFGFSLSCAIQISRELAATRFERIGEFSIRSMPHRN
jgi:hypothetical protein